MMMMALRLLLSFFLVCRAPILAFLPTQGQQHGRSAAAAAATATTTAVSSTALFMGRTPELSKWELRKNGSITGIIRFHPEIDDGDDVTTSILADISLVGPNKIVATKSGSQYKLIGAPLSPIKLPAVKANANAKAAPAVAAAAPVAAVAAKKVTPPSPVRKSLPLSTVKLPPRKELKVTDITIGGGAYVLAGQANRSTSGRSQIWRAYKTDSKGQPTGPELIAKVSSSYEALSRENLNYNRVASGLFSGAFVKKYAFLENADASKPGFDAQSVLVIGAGRMDMKEYLKSRQLKPLRGKALRDAAAAAGQCVQAMHSSSMVWTDLKTENFVLLDEPNADGSISVRAIDLESAQRYGDYPSDFSPEACPPEFAAAYLDGIGPEFTLEPSYDMFSLGMYLFELATGKPYFTKQSATGMIKALRVPDFEADVSGVEDSNLRDLVGKCLQRDPKKRPSITAFLFHPYFTTTGIGAWSF